MANRFRPMLSTISNAGLAQLAGSAGYGFSRAGNQMINLGTEFDKQDARDTAILKAEKEAAKMRDAAVAYNTAINPNMSKNFNAEQLGRVSLSSPAVKDGFTLKDGEARYDANGKQLVKLEKPATTKETKKTVVDKDDFVHIVFNDGSTKNTNIKSKDYWKSTTGNSKDNPLYGYIPAASLDENILANDDLHYALEKAGILKRDKNHMLYVNKEEYDRFKKLGNTEIK